MTPEQIKAARDHIEEQNKQLAKAMKKLTIATSGVENISRLYADLNTENTRLRTLLDRAIGYVTHGDLTKDQIAYDILRDYAAIKEEAGD